VLGSTPIYNYSLSFAPNSNILTANDSVNGNWNYSYDQFNRLICASVSANTACAMDGWPGRLLNSSSWDHRSTGTDRFVRTTRNQHGGCPALGL